MKPWRYQAFGLTISSDIELPMLLGAKKYARAQVKILKGRISKEGFKAARVKALHYQTAPGKLWLEIPMSGRFLITNGNQIKYQPAEKVDNDTIGLFLIGTCMGALLQQRGLIVLHAMAVKHNNKALIFASFSGEGKTTLAAVMHKKSYEILTDDICVIDKNHLVLPGYPMLKIWRDCFRVLKIKPGELKPIRPQVAKYAYPVKTGFSQTPLPAKAMYILHTWNKDQPQITEIKGMHKLMPLQSQIYRAQYLEGMGLMKDNIQNLIKLAGKINITSLTRPQTNYKVTDLIKLIEKDLTNKQKARK